LTVPAAAIALLFAGAAAWAQGPGNVLVVVNTASAESREIGDYYAAKRKIPPANVCSFSTISDEVITRAQYESEIAAPIAACLRSRQLEEKILYIVTTTGVPLRVRGFGSGLASETAAVDSELTLLYSDRIDKPHPTPGGVRNPFFGKVSAPFRHPDFPIYLVTRLTGYDVGDAKALVNRALMARNIGKFVVDLKGRDTTQGNTWLRQAAAQLPRDRVILDQSPKVLAGLTGVIGYASWGSNDPDRKTRVVGFQWLPGAIMTEYVSTNARTFQRPPADWKLGTWEQRSTWFANSPQTLTADYIHEDVTGASGHVAEPFLQFNPRPEILLPAYYRGRNLAESYYLSIPLLSWMNVVIGDPLCAIGKP